MTSWPETDVRRSRATQLDAATPEPRRQPRSMLGYVALPRTCDTIKWVILPIGFLLGCVTGGLPEAGDVVTALLVWLSLELLVYQARYQWNDIRGFDADQQHPGGDRGRLPGPPERRGSRVAWSGGTAATKVLAAVGLCWLSDAGTGATLVLLTVGVFGLAVVYETLRATSTGRTDAAPAPITVGVVAIWIVIGGGYALRLVTGVGLAVDVSTRGPLLPVAVLSGWAFGTAWITSRWAVEATAFARLDGGQLRWHAAPGQGREHQLALARWLPCTVPTSVRDLEHWRAASHRAAWSAPWNVAGVLAAGGAVASGVLMTAPGTTFGVLGLCACLGATSGVAVLAAGTRREVAVILVLPLLVGALAVAGVDQPVRASAPWFALSVAQACYLRQNLASLGQFLRRPAPSARGAHGGRRPAPVA